MKGRVKLNRGTMKARSMHHQWNTGSMYVYRLLMHDARWQNLIYLNLLQLWSPTWTNLIHTYIQLTYISYPVPPWLWWESWQCWTFHCTLWPSFYSIFLEERSPLVNLKFAKKKRSLKNGVRTLLSSSNSMTTFHDFFHDLF